MPDPVANAGAAGSETPTPPASEQPAGGAASGTAEPGKPPEGVPAPNAGDPPKTEGQQPPAKTEDGKQEPPKDGAPETYELKLPENSLLDAAAVERTAATARELGLSQTQAQKALEFVHAEVAAREAAFLETHKPGGAAWVEQEKGWREAALADKELGGSPEKLAATAEHGKRVIEKFGSDELIKFLNDTGFGSHPAVLRFTSKIGRAMQEGSLAMPGTQASGERSAAEVLYGSTTGSPT